MRRAQPIQIFLILRFHHGSELADLNQLLLPCDVLWLTDLIILLLVLYCFHQDVHHEAPALDDAGQKLDC